LSRVDLVFLVKLVMLNDQGFSGRRFEVGFDGWGRRFDDDESVRRVVVMGREGFVCFDGGRGNEGEARAVGRVESDRGGCDAEAPAAPPPLLPAVPVAWFAGMPRERERSRARAENSKKSGSTLSRPRTIPSTHTTSHRGRPTLGVTLSFSCAPLQDLVPLWICYGYHPPHSLLLLPSGIPGLRTPPRTKTHRTTPTFSRITK
jgi:hypothetical protein